MQRDEHQTWHPRQHQREYTGDKTNPGAFVATCHERTTPAHSAPYECRCTEAGPNKNLLGVWTQTSGGIGDANGRAVSQEGGGERKDAPGVAQLHTEDRIDRASAFA